MKVIVTNSYDETCAVIANMIKELVNAKPDAKLGQMCIRDRLYENDLRFLKQF